MNSVERVKVAPLTGSVDRNVCYLLRIRLTTMSLPSRGAWIEIQTPPAEQRSLSVAPLTGSVDRNNINYGTGAGNENVAPLTGSVDRNYSHRICL